MGERDVELAGLFGSGPLVSGCVRHLSRSIGSKRRVLSVGVTVKSRSVLEKFSSCADLERCETIEWE